jgi:mRNA-degrading endonuclease toxin of MazEF toxin-antitoxin module
MNLPLYSSTSDFSRPNLVGLQHPGLTELPTQLVCPIRENLTPTPVRTHIRWGGLEFVVACDLLRPINSASLKRLGELNASDSLKILQTFQLLLASDP